LSISPDNIVNTPWSDASEEARQDALTRILGTPFMLTDLSIDGIHQACFENQAVILEVQVGTEWYTAENGDESWDPALILPIRPPQKVIDSHFVLVGAYDEPNDRTWLCNSWSQQWGQNGFGYFGSNYAPFIKGGIAFKQIPASVAQVLNTPAIEAPQKQTIIQSILQDLEQVLGLMSKEVG
jgi:hypothetical protein